MTLSHTVTRSYMYTHWASIYIKVAINEIRLTAKPISNKLGSATSAYQRLNIDVKPLSELGVQGSAK